ncbi:hypothetical protein EYF80_023628 [Liparis tanakae]|uniref:Uncharacterized protein n=1 Tax=Liparis tanakae TaxID=230148 RepID=A0A4Z2HKS1_9TELE|nr:hypothetical protein EYF80_023628 [Liparis tanakae]
MDTYVDVHAIIVVIYCGLGGRRHAGSGPWLGGRPGGAGERPRVVERQRVGVRPIVRWRVRRSGSAGGRGLRLPQGLESLRRLRGRVARSMDRAVFAGVASRGDGWMMSGAGWRSATARSSLPALLCAELGYNLRSYRRYLDPTTQNANNTTTNTSATQARLLSL